MALTRDRDRLRALGRSHGTTHRNAQGDGMTVGGGEEFSTFPPTVTRGSEIRVASRDHQTVKERTRLANHVIDVWLIVEG